MLFRYAGVIAINPNTDQTEIVKSATGTVHLDENWETPVEVHDVNGFAMTTLNTTVEGLFPDFYVEDQPVVGFKTSSGHRFYLRSSTPVPGPAGPPPVSVTAPDGNFMFEYEDGTRVPGPPVPVGDEQMAQLASDSSSSLYSSLVGLVANAITPGMVIATPDRFPNLRPGEAVDSAQGIMDAVEATPDGGTLVIPGGVYTIATTIRITQRNITVLAHGAVFVKAGRVAMLEAVGGYDTTYSVASVATTTITNSNGSSGPGTALSVSGDPGWTVGTVVKVVADDAIPESRPGDSTVASRVGRFMVVHSTTAGTVTLVGGLGDAFTTNVRVARLRDYSLRLHGMRIRVATELLTGLDNTPVINLVNLDAPEVHGVTVDTAQGTALRFASCYRYSVTGCRVGYASNDPGVGNYGYGVQDVGCAFGRVDGYTAGRVRHAFTDDSSRISANSSLTGYGRSYGAIVTNSHAHATSEAAWDTHHSGERHTFANVTATDCRGTAVNLRGRRHVVRGVTDTHCLGSVTWMTEAVGGQSWGHTVTGIESWESRDAVVRTDMNPAGHPTAAGVRETRPLVVSGVRAWGVSRLVLGNNATVHLSNVEATALPTLPTSTGMVILNNTEVRVEGMTLDYRPNTAGSSLRIFWTWDDQASTIQVESMHVRNLSGHSTRINKFFDVSSATMVRARDVSLDYRVANMESPATASLFQWRLTTDMAASALVTTAAPADVSTLRGVQSSPDPVVTLQTYQTAPVVLGQLPDPLVRGQMLNVINCSTTTGATVTIYNAAAGSNTRTKSGGNIVLDLNQAALFTWDSRINAWTQLA